MVLTTPRTCPVCMEPFVAGKVVWRLPCLHRVHSDCASMYFGRRAVQPSCPVCRFDLRSVALHLEEPEPPRPLPAAAGPSSTSAVSARDPSSASTTFVRCR
mmetsp:Transcript_121601/g.389101  ORF Transcript_121601/g.389101 Transcript_121601/m.389101 type:complete len:101 (-) Transcript_121601:187-489(-)